MDFYFYFVDVGFQRLSVIYLGYIVNRSLDFFVYK